MTVKYHVTRCISKEKSRSVTGFKYARNFICINSNHIKFKFQVEDVGLDIESAIPCALIVNELVSNALKYAFPNKQEGEILVKLYKCENGLTMIVQDNGVGLPVDFDQSKTKTLGINLIQGLVKQLQGTIEINSYQGTRFKMNWTADKSVSDKT